MPPRFRSIIHFLSEWDQRRPFLHKFNWSISSATKQKSLAVQPTQVSLPCQLPQPRFKIAFGIFNVIGDDGFTTTTNPEQQMVRSSFCPHRPRRGHTAIAVNGGGFTSNFWMQRPKWQMVSILPILPWQIFLLRKWQNNQWRDMLESSFLLGVETFMALPYPKKVFVCPRSLQSRLKTKSLL